MSRRDNQLRGRGLRTRALALAALVLTAFGLNLLAPRAAHAIPTMSPQEIIARAESAMNSSYTWGGESWVANEPGTGPDCSGFVLKCWQTPRTMLYQEEDPSNASVSPRYTTAEFMYNTGPWTSLTDRSYLQPGDALVKHSSGGGHVVLYAGGDKWGYPTIYESPYTGGVVRRISRYLGDEYQPRRRNVLSESTLLLDNPTAKTTNGTDLAGNWTRSTSTAGYLGDNYQVRAGTTATSWARWTPRFPATGYYDVYLRWTAGWNRATNAKVTINTPEGQYVQYVDQTVQNGTWVWLGRYPANAGYTSGSGSVAIHATGANGYVVADSCLWLPVQ
jgi:hypothetical protein